MANCITTDEVKSQARIDTSADDTLIAQLISAAESWAQKYRSEKFIQTECVDYFDCFDTKLELLYSPVVSITSIQYVDSNGDTQTLDSSYYTLCNKAVVGPGEIVEAYNMSWPSTRNVPDAVTVTYQAGYGEASTDVPNDIRQGVMLMVAHMYENREALAAIQLHEVPFGVSALLGIDRRIPV